MPTALGLAGLVLALTWLAIGVHVHGWVTAFDASTASWIRSVGHRSHYLSVGHRSHYLDEASLITAWLGTPVKVAAAGLIGGALLAGRARSLWPGAVVIGTVGGAALAETAMKAVVYRPPTEAEIQASPLLSTGHHPFPSGHVAGTGALLGIIAVCIAIGLSRIVQALATVLVGAGVVIVAFSRLYLGCHWLSDVIGGALLAGVAVILGTVALTTRCQINPSVPGVLPAPLSQASATVVVIVRSEASTWLAAAAARVTSSSAAASLSLGYCCAVFVGIG